MHEIPNFPFPSQQEPKQSILAQQELGQVADMQAPHPAEDVQNSVSDD